MEQIVFHEGLIACDRLNCEELKAGENLRVKFPDGTIGHHAVMIITDHFDHHGLKLEILRRRSFINVNVHGRFKWITAVGLMAERV